MKTMSNLLHHRHEDDGDGSSSGNEKCKCRTRRICTKNGCNYDGHRRKSLPEWVAVSKGQSMLVSYQCGKVQINIAQMLRVPWSKVTSIGDKFYFRYFVYSENIRVRYSGMLLVLGVFHV